MSRFTGRIMLSEPRKVAGYIEIADGLRIAVHTKPAAEHMGNMNAWFGWKWIDSHSATQPLPTMSEVEK